MASLSERMIGSAKLDVHTYEEVEADTNATGQALMVVVLSSIAQGIGTLTLGGLWGLLAGTVSALVGWFIWAFLVYLIGTKLLPEPIPVRTCPSSCAPQASRPLRVCCECWAWSHCSGA